MAKAIRTSELRMVARSKGWSGKSNTSKEEIIAWLSARGINDVQISQIVRNLRDLASGRATAPAGPAASVDRAQVEAMVKEMVASQVVSSQVDEKVLRKLIQECAGKALPPTINITVDGKTYAAKMKKRVHPLFEKVLRLVKAGMNVLLVGPAGCGKSTLAEQVAEAMKRRYGVLHCTAGSSESHLTGWLLPIEGNGKFVYVSSEFVDMYESGDALFLLDEIDAADPNMLLVINGALANDSLHIPHRYKEPRVKRGKNFSFIAAANTFGMGGDVMYAGRNQLDAATLDRFYTIRMDYDSGLENEFLPHDYVEPTRWTASTQDVTTELLTEIGNWISGIRSKVADNRMRRMISTRTFMKAAAALQVGISVAELKVDLLAGWTRDELVKVGVGA